MRKPVLSVGQCGPDHGMLSRFLKDHFGVDVVGSATLDSDSLDRVRKGDFSLVLVNRKLDIDYSDGLEIIKQILSDGEAKRTPVMLVTNYAEHQGKSVALGGLYGFGKLEYGKPETLERLEGVLGPRLTASTS
jgi:CheY-like chemotaxis protein